MNIDELTLGQVKELRNIFGERETKTRHKDIGKKVIIRTYSAGVHYGTLESKDGGECTLTNAIRIWQWYGAASLSQLAMEGTKDSEQCKFAMPVDTITLKWIEVIPCTEEAQKSIEGVTSWKK